MKVYQYIAQEIGRYYRLQDMPTASVRPGEVLNDLDDYIKKTFPSGSGIDCGTKLNLDRSNPNRIVLRADFHHMDEHGSYDGWTEHEIVVTPDLQFDFNIRITGRNRNDIKDYLGQLFNYELNKEKV